MNYLEWLYRVSEEDTDRFEPAVINLAMVARAGVPVPAGFVVSKKLVADYFAAPTLKNSFQKLFKGVSTARPALFAGVAKEARSLILKKTLSSESRDLLKAYLAELQTRLLHNKTSSLPLLLTGMGAEEVRLQVSVRTGADLDKALRQLVVLCFSETDLLDRAQKNRSLLPEAFSIAVQVLPEPKFSGFASCHDSQTLDDTVIEITAWPLLARRQQMVSTEDVFRIDRKHLALLSRSVQKQAWAESATGKFLSPAHLEEQLTHMSDEQAIQLARLIHQAAGNFIQTMKFDWAYSHNQFLITQARQMNISQAEVSPETAPLLQGLPASFGQVSGLVRLITRKADRVKLQAGEIAVVEHLTEADRVWLRPAAGIIAETGNKTSLEAELARKLLKPAAVGVSRALSSLSDGQMVTLDGSTGAVHRGKLEAVPYIRPPLPIIGTKIYSTVFDPYQITKQALESGDGVGLLRSEFIIRLLGVHPEDLLKRSLAKEYQEVLTEGISRVVDLVNLRPVIYQLHDVNSMDLLGFRPRHQDRHEPNPVLGYRGAHRLLSEPEILDLELGALAKLASQGKTNVQIMVPMVRTLKEVERMLYYLNHSELAQELPVKMWVKCETPGLLIQMEELIALDVAGVCFDVPSLTQFIQGIDRENRQVAHYLDPTDSAALEALEYAIRTCRLNGVPTSIVAEMEELRPEVVQTAVQAGVTAVCVPPASILPTHDLVAAIEQRMLLDHLLDESQGEA